MRAAVTPWAVKNCIEREHNAESGAGTEKTDSCFRWLRLPIRRQGKVQRSDQAHLGRQSLCHG